MHGDDDNVHFVNDHTIADVADDVVRMVPQTCHEQTRDAGVIQLGDKQVSRPGSGKGLVLDGEDSVEILDLHWHQADSDLW